MTMTIQLHERDKSQKESWNVDAGVIRMAVEQLFYAMEETPKSLMTALG